METKNRLPEWNFVHFQLIEGKNTFGLVFTTEGQALKGLKVLESWKERSIRIYHTIDGGIEFNIGEAVHLKDSKFALSGSALKLDGTVKAAPQYQQFLHYASIKDATYLACLFSYKKKLWYVPGGELPKLFPVMMCSVIEQKLVK